MSFHAATINFATKPADGLHPRNAIFGGTNGTATATTDDPRVSGVRSFHWNQDIWGDPASGPMAIVQWGTARIENADGAWEGKGSGIYSSDRGDMIVFWFRGTGHYAGLGYFELLSGHSPWNIRGQVFPGEPPSVASIPPVSGAAPSPNVDAVPTPGPIASTKAFAYGPVSVFQGSSEYTYVGIGDTVWAGINTTNDPRVTGPWLAASWKMTAWGGTADSIGAGTQTGANRLTNAGGAWDGLASGIFDDRGDVIAIWNKGSGGYAGLSDFELFTRSDLFGPVTGEVGPAVFGMIFPGDPPRP